ncbi:MAG: hypothetical protein CM1200mP26_01550 [Acidimicrobiales bacterium]|nr:MAG: hypothetical protein CM1200mP26_01550 [Acidimicrobiales bacterium]
MAISQEPAETSTPSESMGGSEILRVEDLHTSFFLPIGELQAVRGVSFTLKRGQSLGIVGESGSGKTVLARSIMGLTLAKHVETSGKAFFNGRDLLTLSRREMRSLWGTEIAMIFQDPMTSLNPMVKIGRQVIEHLRQHKNVDRREAKKIALDLLNEVRTPEAESRIDRLPHELSGGMRQRVSIASALACEPSLLFADEPTTALDVTVQHQILNLLSREQRQRNMTMVLVTHDLGVIAGRTDETLVMYAGKVFGTGSDGRNLRQHPTPVHGSAHAFDSANKPAKPYAVGGDHRPPTGGHPPSDGLCVQSPLPLCAAEVSRGGPAAGFDWHLRT